MLLHIPIVHSYRCWVVVHYIDLSVYLLLDGQSECLQFLSITEKAVMNIMYKSLNRYVKLLGEQNGYIKRWVCICLLRNYQTISQSVCVILYSHQPFLQRWTLQRPVNMSEFGWGKGTGYNTFNWIFLFLVWHCIWTFTVLHWSWILRCLDSISPENKLPPRGIEKGKITWL